MGFQLTEACNACCRHCCTSSSPRKRTICNPEDIIRWIFDLAALCPDAEISFTGGEVFVVREILWRAIQAARDAGLRYTISTNGYWASDVSERRRILTELQDCSLLGFSLSLFHKPFVDPSIVVQALRQAVDLGIPSLIRYVKTLGEDEAEIIREMGVAGTRYASHVRFGQVMSIGRADSRLHEQAFPVFPLDEPCIPASAPTIRYDGTVFACCGEAFYIEGNNPLRLGDLYMTSLADILSMRDDNVVLHAIRTIGPRRLVEMCGFSDLQDRDVIRSKSPCGSCRVLFDSEKRSSAAGHVAAMNSAKITALRAAYYGELCPNND